MELKDTVDRMLSAEYEDRLIAEYQQVGIRIEKLRNFLFNYDQGTLVFEPASKRITFKRQLDAMMEYQAALTQRIKDEKLPGFGCFGDSCVI